MSLRYRVCPDCRELHPVADWPQNHRRWDEVLCAPSVISDIMPPVQSMGNGKVYDSKSEMRKHYKRDGLVEVGNDPARHRKPSRPKPDDRAIVDSIRKAEARVERGDITERIKHTELTRVGRKPPRIETAGPNRGRGGVVKPEFRMS